MNRQEFLRQLQDRLQGVDAQDKADVLHYFDELIQDKASDENRPEEDIIAQLGSMDTIANTVLEGAAQREQQAQQHEKQPTQPGATRTMTAAANSLREVHIEAFSLPVRILPGGEDDIEVSYPQDERHQFQVTVEDGKLHLVRQPQHSLRMFVLDLWNLSRGPALEITLRLPQEYAGALDVRTSNCQVRMKDIHVWGGLTLTTSNAKMNVRRCQARDICLTTSNARATAEELDTRGDLTVRTSNSRLEAVKLRSGGLLTLRTSNARLQVVGIQAPRIDLKTSNANLEGEVQGAASDYTVLSATSNGKNSLASHPGHGPHQLSAKTSNGNIRVKFSQP